MRPERGERPARSRRHGFSSPLNPAVEGAFLFMPDPELCVTVAVRKAQAMVRAREAAEADADLGELRLDMMERPEPAAALSGRRRKGLATWRPGRARGDCEGPAGVRLRVLP